MPATGILGVGGHVPPVTVGNGTISAWSGAPEPWIVERTGILSRRYAEPGRATSDLAEAAVRDLVGGDPAILQRVDVMVLATSTPDQPQPPTAAILQHKLGLSRIPAFDINAVCSGFVYALSVARGMLTANGGGYGLVVAADMYSTIMDRDDRRTVSLFGDGAGAALLGPVPDGYGLLATRLATHGDHRELIQVVAGGTREPVSTESIAAGRDRFRMNGRAVRDYALQTVPKLVDEVLGDVGLDVGDIDRVILHQGNARLVEALAERLGVPMDRVPLTAVGYGNTGAASIPITLKKSAHEQPLRRGERILLAAVGGGMAAGAAVLAWH